MQLIQKHSFFQQNEIYHMELQITGLLKSAQTPDFTRNGVATGYVVVPEFPSSATSVLLVAALFGGMIVIDGLRLKRARISL